MTTSELLGIGGGVVAVVGVMITVYFGRRQRNRKILAYQVSSARVVSVRDEAADKITILYDEHPVGDVRLLTLQVKCAGNVPIASADFERPLTLLLGEKAQVLKSEVVKTAPEDLNPQYAIRDSTLEIEPLLLNPGDSLEMTALVSDLDNADHLDGRIVGINKFSKLATSLPTEWPLSSRQTIWAIYLALALALVLVLRPLAIDFVRLFSQPQAYPKRSAYANTRVRLRQGGSMCGSRVVSEAGRLTLVILKNGHRAELNPYDVEGIEPYSC